MLPEMYKIAQCIFILIYVKVFKSRVGLQACSTCGKEKDSYIIIINS